jgi:hypothetical protein
MGQQILDHVSQARADDTAGEHPRQGGRPQMQRLARYGSNIGI